METRAVPILLMLTATIWMLNNKSNKFFVVQSGSMEPAMKIGDVLVVREQPKYTAGEVITFATKEGRIVTHRIAKVDSGGKYITKGDANRVEDFMETDTSRVKGKVNQIIPKLGLLGNFARSGAGFFTFFLIPIVMPLVGETLALKK